MDTNDVRGRDHSSTAERAMRRLSHARRCDDRGVTLVIGALLMVVLVGFVGFAVDVGLAYNERRQEQSAVDTAVLSGAREALLRGATDDQIFDEVTRLSHQNMDNPPPLDDWRREFENCVDPARVAAGFTEPLSTSRGDIDCISFDTTRSELRVMLPTTELDTAFASVLGFDRWEISAFAEAGLAEGPGNPNILPFTLSSGDGGSGTTCLKTPPNGQAELICSDGSQSGNFGYLAMPRPSFEGNQRCNGGWTTIVINNIAQGADHELSTRPGPNSGTQIDDYCPEISAGLQPNHVYTQTGNVDSRVAAGLVEGVSTDKGGAITDGQDARLTRGPWDKTLCPKSGSYPCIDDRGFWEFFDVGDVAGGTVAYDGVVADGHAPVICDPAFITTPPNPAIGVNSLTGPLLQARIEACFDAYDAGGYTADLLIRDSDGNGVEDILETPRFTWLPESWEVINSTNCSGSNCDYSIKRFTPVFIQNLYYHQGGNYWVVPPGAGPLGASSLMYDKNGSKVGSAGGSLRGSDAFVLNEELLPQSILDERFYAGQFDLTGVALTR